MKEFDHIRTIDQRYNTLSKVSPQESLEKIENKIQIATIKQKPKQFSKNYIDYESLVQFYDRTSKNRNKLSN